MNEPQPDTSRWYETPLWLAWLTALGLRYGVSLVAGRMAGQMRGRGRN